MGNELVWQRELIEQKERKTGRKEEKREWGKELSANHACTFYKY